MTDYRMMQAYTQAPATSDAKVGGAFTLWGGSVSGSYTELVADTKIAQTWRFSDWKDGDTSTVTIDLTSPSYGVTVVKLVQTNVPEEDKFGNRSVQAKVADGWQSKFFQPIQRTLGFALIEDDSD